MLDETTYYISAFAVDWNGIIINVQSNVITTDFFYGKYQKVEYIQSDWNQIIDTWVYWTWNTSILTKMVVTSRKGNYDMYYWAYWDGNIRAFFMQSNYPDNNKIRVVNYSNDDATRKYVDSINNLQFNTEYIIEHTNTTFKINWTVQWTMASSSFTTNYTLCVFWIHGKTWTLTPKLIWKVYYFKIYNNWTLVRDFAPCYRKSDSVIWLLDIVNKQFYSNAWSWTFTKWSNVPR